jgi:hypothetical protein
MLSNPIQIAEAINHPKFHQGDEVILAEGPHKYMRGIFVSLKEDVEWASVREANGAINSHPVEWMSSYRGPSSYNTFSGRSDKKRGSQCVNSVRS